MTDNHTPGDWQLGYDRHDDGIYTVMTPPKAERDRRLDANELPFTVRLIATLKPSPYLPEATAEECARRLAAAWNACAALTTEALEAGVVKALLAACKAALVDEYFLSVEIVDQLRSSIALAEAPQ